MLCIPGEIVDRVEPYTVDRHVPVRQSDNMDLESATLAMIVEVVRHQQRRQDLATTRIKRKSIHTTPAHNLASLAVRTASAVRTLTVPPARPDSRELNTLAKISKGEGVSSYDTQGLLEQCGICNMYFTGTVLCKLSSYLRVLAFPSLILL